MIYYPLSTLMLAGIRDVLSSPRRTTCARFQRLLGDGAQLGPPARATRCSRRPTGSPQAFIIGARLHRRRPRRRWCSATTSSSATACPSSSRRAATRPTGATVFAYRVARSRALRRRRVRRRGPRALASRRSRRSRNRTAPSPASISTTTRWSRSPRRVKPSARGELRSPTSTSPI